MLLQNSNPSTENASTALQWPEETSRLVCELTTIAPKGVFMTGIENSDPIVDGIRRNQLTEADNFYENWERRLNNIHRLGIKWVRFGEGYSQVHTGNNEYNFALTDKVMNKSRELGITVVADLLHFGLPEWLHKDNPNEPYFQNPRFPEEFAKYAGAYTKRYPAIKYFTLVNEPTTTIELSARFGLWNEQVTSTNWEDDRGYVKAAANISRAYILARQAIQQVWEEESRPGGPIFFENEAFEQAVATPDSKREIEAERFNLRRFVNLDLILGHRDQTMKDYLLSQGLTNKQYEWFMHNGTSKRTVLGIDYYLWCVSSLGATETTPSYPLIPSKFVNTPYALHDLAKEYWQRYPLPLIHMEVNGWPENAVETADNTYKALQQLKDEGYPIIGMSWFGDELQIGWHYVFTGPHGNEETPVGLFYKGRQEPVADRFRELVEKGF